MSETQPPNPRSIALLEDNLALIGRAVADCFDTARQIAPGSDEYGHARHAAYHDAVTLLKVSAKIGQTLATIQGGKFSHNVHVTRESVPARRRVARKYVSDQDVASPPPPEDFEGSNG